ncbi:MAG TPA: choice-of-anchor tandem repeat GloVer-containing protein [Acetobacteraceae bacterium]|nr:choice-of-anchor tandem repeat GloVer-containing protein [Acetobacteraceae bacterium]
MSRSFAAIALVATPIGLAALPAHASSYQTLYTFSVINQQGVQDGQHPVGPLAAIDGVLYGNTSAGGSYGNGAMYSLTRTGVETVLHSYNSLANDGAVPSSGFVHVNGSLYTATEYGGSGLAGALEQLSLSGQGTVVFSYNQVDGQTPLNNGGPTNIGKVVYITAPSIDGYSIGTVTAYDTQTGQSSELYDFYNSPVTEPDAGLTHIGKILYGTSRYGGQYGYGTVYSLTQSGTLTVLYSFTNGADGAYPTAKLTPYNGVLYGVASEGGANSSGTAFAIHRDGKFKKLYDFGGSLDGGTPGSNGFIVYNGLLYGLLSDGGQFGTGLLYSMTTKGVLTPLYSFGTNPSDGTAPTSELTELKGVLYGITGNSTGTYNLGTVFAFTP